MAGGWLEAAQSGAGEVFGLVHGDARRCDEVLAARARQLHPESPDDPFLTVTVTSPPYGRLIDYGAPDQIGFGQSWADYMDDCRAVFASVHRWTRDDGALWVVADTLLGDRPTGREPSERRGVSELRLLPFELARAAATSGWTLREVVIWHKDRTLPWSGQGRMRNAFEYVLLLVKSSSYKYNVGRLRDHADLGRWWVRYPERYSPHGIAPENVWFIPIPVQGSWQASAPRHDCPFPPDLVRRILLLSSDDGDVVFDPFAGSGTVLAVAETMGRIPFGMELNSSFIAEYSSTLRPQILKQWAAGIADHDGSSLDVARTIWLLRCVKFPKVLLAQLANRSPESAVPSLVLLTTDVPGPSEIAASSMEIALAFVCTDVSEERREELRQTLEMLSNRRPLTKFGINPTIRVVDEDEFLRLAGAQQLFMYERGKTWETTGDVTPEAALKVQPWQSRGRHIPIAANIELRVRFPEDD